MPFCTSCGEQITTNAAFCHECGAPSAGSQKAYFTDTPNTYQSLPSQVKVSENIEQALFWSKQVVWAFLLIGLSVTKGAEGIDSIERNLRFDFIISTYAFIILLMAVTYIFLVVKGVKENNANYVLITAIFFTVLSVLGFFLDDHSFSNYNFWDWLGFFVGLIQVIVMYRIYFTLLKSA
jgi:hypothetical protein